MKKENIATYLLSGVVPLIIFLLMASMNGFLPIGDSLMHIYDSFTQYPGFLLEYKNLLSVGNIMYSWNAASGFNFYGTLTYYAMSPLNLLCLFATPRNYPYFIAFMTYLRIFLLGSSMCFYLVKRGTKKIYIVLFSTMYALMGFTATYFYNFQWIDAIIVFPIVVCGLDYLIEKEKSGFYIFALASLIIISYYIGYMVSIFSFIYFLYKTSSAEHKLSLKIVKKFVISSILAISISAIVLIPSYFALKTGKASLYKTVDYSGISKNAITIFPSLMSGNFVDGDHSYGPAQVYVGIVSVVLVIFYFFNPKFSKKNKMCTLLVLLFFYLSFSINFLNYAWQFFQKPIWWQSRFSFTFSFFLLLIALSSLENIEYLSFDYLKRGIISAIFIVLVITGAIVKSQDTLFIGLYNHIFMAFSILLFLEMMFFADKKSFLPLVIFFTFFDVTINTFNSLKQNDRGSKVSYYSSLREELPDMIKDLKSQNENFFRLEMQKNYTSNDGLYFDYHGINYFNSARNVKEIKLLEKLGMEVQDDCSVLMKKFDPLFLSLFGVKYILGDIPYFEEYGELSVNPHALGLGFIANRRVAELQLTDKSPEKNLNALMSSLTGRDVEIYETISHEKFSSDDVISQDGKFIRQNEIGTLTYKFKSDSEYLLIPNTEALLVEIEIDDSPISYNDVYVKIDKESSVKVSYKIFEDKDVEDIFLTLLDVEKYEENIALLGIEVLEVIPDNNRHILSASIVASHDESFLFTSINYEEGMSIKVDGEVVKPIIVLDTLVGLELSEGKHEIVIDYLPKGFKSGVVISLSGILISIAYLQRDKKRL